MPVGPIVKDFGIQVWVDPRPKENTLKSVSVWNTNLARIYMQLDAGRVVFYDQKTLVPLPAESFMRWTRHILTKEDVLEYVLPNLVLLQPHTKTMQEKFWLNEVTVMQEFTTSDLEALKLLANEFKNKYLV